MLGAIIGAGVFAVPYAFKTMGVLTGSLVFWGVVGILLLTHVLYADVILSDPLMRRTRLYRQVQHVLGDWPSYLALVTHPLSLIGACLAYLMLGGTFLASLSSAMGVLGNPLAWQLVFWVGGAISVFFGIKTVSWIQSSMGWVLVGLLALSVVVVAPGAHLSVLLTSHTEGILSMMGVLVFALSGFQIIPEIVEIGGRQRRRVMLSIIIGTLIAAFLEWLFAVSTYAAVGNSLLPGVQDLTRAYPSSLFWLLPAVGFVSVAAAFVSMAQELKSVFHLDFHIPEHIGWMLALGAPLIMLVVVQQDFMQTVGFVGSVFGSLNGMLISAMAISLAKQKKILQGSMLQGAPYVCLLVFVFAFLWRIILQ